MSELSTADVAATLEITPKALRRFLRADPFYVNAGCGGRYSFKRSDMATMIKRYATWASTKPTAKPAYVDVVDEPGLDVSVIYSSDPVTHTLIDQLNAGRVERLRAQLAASRVAC